MTISDVYDADVNLLLQTDSTTAGTLYLGDAELHTAVGPTTATASTYSACGMPIAERPTTPAASESRSSPLVCCDADHIRDQGLEVSRACSGD